MQTYTKQHGLEGNIILHLISRDQVVVPLTYKETEAAARLFLFAAAYAWHSSILATVGSVGCAKSDRYDFMDSFQF